MWDCLNSVDNLNKLDECIICYYEKPVIKCNKCTATICKDCCQKTIDKTNECVVCRQDFHIKEEQTMKRDIYDIEIRCSWKYIGYFPCCCCCCCLWCFVNL